MGIDVPLFGAEFDQGAIDATHAEAVEARRQADATRDFVTEHFRELRGVLIPIETLEIQNLPHHNCLIVNDHLLLSYREAEPLIKEVMHVRGSSKA